MPALFEEIDSQPSALGEISLRKRVIPVLGPNPIYEVKLGDEYLMSSMFVKAEEELAHLGLAATEGEALSVVVGGLGLGYTAVAALQDVRIGELLVVDALDTVIQWHRRELVPLGKILNADDRARYVLGSFFDLAVGEQGGFDAARPGRRFDAILLDIDHSPSEFLNAGNAAFYRREKLSAMARQLVPGGVFAMWSQNPPAPAFVALLDTVFAEVETHMVTFYNPFQQQDASNSVYVCKTSHD
jgi:spermidine synthase